MIKRVIVSLLKEEYDSAGHDTSVSRLNRFIYTFRQDVSKDIPFKEWLNVLDSDGTPYSDMNKKRPEIAKVVYGEQTAKARNDRFLGFYNECKLTDSLDGILNVMAKYPEIFILQY